MFGINKNFSIHFIGIGGIGMSGIAEILLNLGYKVSGSDISSSEVIQRLKALGAKVYLGHKSTNVENSQIVVYSSAIKEENPEYDFAIKNQIPLIKRAEMLAELMRLKHGIAVAGSHGKTTTTSFLAAIFNIAEMDPTHIIGGVVKNLGGNAKNGKGDILIAEADESDGSFLYLNPIHSIITNIDDDHLDYYKTREKIVEAFVAFANKIPFYGRIALNAHDENTAKVISQIKRPYITFAIEEKKAFLEDIDYLAQNIKYDGDSTSFEIKNNDEVTRVTIKLIGEHNVLNALAAFAISHQLILNKELLAKGLAFFEGVARRLEKIYHNKLIILDDYAHHPTEIKATLSAVKKNNKKVVVIYEPHRYSRTKDFWNEFVEVFTDQIEVYILPIYPASEKPIPYIDSEILVKNINKKGGQAEFVSTYNDMLNIFRKHQQDENTIMLTLGAGPISYKAKTLVKEI